MYQISKERAQAMFTELADDLRNNRAFLIIDSKSHDSTAYFQVAAVHSNGLGIEYQPLMNFLGFKPWINRCGTQEGNRTKCAGRFSFYVWYNIRTNAEDKGLEIPADFGDLIQKQIPHF